MGDGACSSAGVLGWLVYEHEGNEPHVTVFYKSARKNDPFSCDDLSCDPEHDVYYCPGGTRLAMTRTLVNDGMMMLYRALQHQCALKPRCCQHSPARKVPRSIHEGTRDTARQIAKPWECGTSRRLRKKVEMLFAYLKRILKLDRLRLGPTALAMSSHSQPPPRI